MASSFSSAVAISDRGPGISTTTPIPTSECSDQLQAVDENSAVPILSRKFAYYFIDHQKTKWEELLVEQFNRDGLVSLGGVQSRDEFIHILSRLGRLFPHRDSEKDGLTRIASDGKVIDRTGYLGFSTDGMDVHTDRSGIENPPDILAMWCRQQACEGGESIFVDGRELFQRCRKFSPALFQAITRSNSVALGGAERLFLGSVFRQRSDGWWEIRFRSDELGYFTASLLQYLPELKGLFAGLAISFTLLPGQCYIASNNRWLHGRSSYSGPREMYRGLLHAIDKTPSGFCIRTGFKDE